MSDERPAGSTGATDPGEARATFSVPGWLRQFGYASWLLIGIVVVLAGIAAALQALNTIVIPTLFAILLGATFLPVVDWMERRHIKRWISALLVTLLITAAGILLLVVVAVGLIRQAPTIAHQIDAALGSVQDLLHKHNVDPDIVTQVKSSVKKAAQSLGQGAVSDLIKGIQSLASLIFGIFIALNILVYVLIGGRRIGRWLSTVAKPVPEPVAYAIIRDSARFMRGYIWGSTVIGVFNGAVVGIGAVIIGVPLAFTLAVVNWATNYIPMFGALIGGAFSVLIALGVGGWQKAILMLIIVLVANGPLQTVVSQFALGAALNLNGLVVLFATTIGAIVAGAIGGVFAAPFTKIAIDGYRRLKDAGLFDAGEPVAQGVVVTDAGPPPGPPPPDASRHAPGGPGAPGDLPA